MTIRYILFLPYLKLVSVVKLAHLGLEAKIILFNKFKNNIKHVKRSGSNCIYILTDLLVKKKYKNGCPTVVYIDYRNYLQTAQMADRRPNCLSDSPTSLTGCPTSLTDRPTSPTDCPTDCQTAQLTVRQANYLSDIPTC